jgi:dienelactone hydrolase
MPRGRLATKGRRVPALAFLLAALLAPLAARAETIAVPLDYQGRQIELSGSLDKPSGAGPFPVVILLHGCGGNNPYALGRSVAWARLLHAEGYATFILDSFTARSYSSGVCGNARMVSAEERARDVYAAALILSARPDIRADRIAVMGFSHGGWTVLDAASANREELAPWRDKLKGHGKLVAFVAFYPNCAKTEHDDFLGPVFVLVGDKDGLSPYATCERSAKRSRAGAAEFRLKVYPGAVHDFDYERASGVLRGTPLAYDAAAAADARVQVADFLRPYLK